MSSLESTANMTTTTEVPSKVPISNSSLFHPSAPLMKETVTASNNDSFVYSSPTVEFKSLLNGVDTSCYKVSLNKLVHRPVALCYGLQVNALLKHPANDTERDLLIKHPLTNNLAYAENFTKYFDQKFTPQLILKSHTQQVEELFANFSTVRKPGTTTSLSVTGAGECNRLLWNFIALPGPPRFIMLNPCVTVTGNVSVVRFPADGDIVLALTLDKPYRNMVTTGNFNDKMTGGLWVELICQRPLISAKLEPFKIGECNGYNGPIFTLPKVGDHLKVTGAYVLDVREGGHAEIHPTSSLSKIIPK
jgi:hypothetical protein